MWYGRLATTSYGGSTRWTRSWSSASPSMSRRSGSSANRSRRNAARPRSSSTAVTSAPPARRAPVRKPRPGPISRIRRPGAGSACARIASRTSGSARKFCDRLCRARRPAARSVVRTVSGSTRGGAVPLIRPRPGRPAAAMAGRRGRGRPARPRRTAARRPRRSSPRCPCTAPVAARSAGRPSASASPGEAGPQDAVGGDPAAHHDRAGAAGHGGPDRLGHEDVDDRVLEAPGELGDDLVGERLVGVGREAGIGPGLGDDPAGRGLEAGEAQVVAIAQPGPREDPVVPRSRPRPRGRSPARPGSPGRAAARPCRTPRRRRRRGSSRGADRPGGRASRRGTCGRRRRPARRAGRRGRRDRPRRGRAARRRRRGPRGGSPRPAAGR